MAFPMSHSTTSPVTIDPEPKAATVKYFDGTSWQLYAGYPDTCDIENTYLAVRSCERQSVLYLHRLQIRYDCADPLESRVDGDGLLMSSMRT